MVGFLVRLLVTALGLAIASATVPGLHVQGAGSLLLAALLLGFVNAVVRPVVVVLTFPITLITLGLFLWVVNAAMLGLVAWLMQSFAIDGLLPALLGSLIVGLVGWLASWTIGPSGRYELLIVTRN